MQKSMIVYAVRPGPLDLETVAQDNTHGNNWKLHGELKPVDPRSSDFYDFNFTYMQNTKCDEGWEALYFFSPTYADGGWTLGAN